MYIALFQNFTGTILNSYSCFCIFNTNYYGCSTNLQINLSGKLL